MSEIKNLIKDDINFLEHPNWVVNDGSKLKELIIKKDKGVYEIKAPEGLPNHFDKIVLYYLLNKWFEGCCRYDFELKTTRYEIAKGVFVNTKDFGKSNYDRIMKSLSKWACLTIKFDGLFYEKDNYTFRIFHIIDNIILDKKTNKLTVGLNKQYIKQLEESKFYKLINFNEYRSLFRPVSARLYEILIKTFKERYVWKIEIGNLAEKLTIEKRKKAKNYYPSDIHSLILPAINEINKKTELQIKYVKESNNICVFTKLVSSVQSRENITENKLNNNSLENLLVNYGIPIDNIQQIIEIYPEEKIRNKIELLKQNKKAIANITGWLMTALKEDWTTIEYDNQKEAQKIKEERERKLKEEEDKKKKTDSLKSQYIQYKELTAQIKYSNLLEQDKEIIDNNFKIYFENQCRVTGTKLPEETFKLGFLIKNLLKEDEQDFDKWLQKMNSL